MSQKIVFTNFQLVDSEFKSIKNNQALLSVNGIITDFGSSVSLLKKYSTLKCIDLQKAKIFPSFVECHTHSVFGGSRADEFELRNQGVSYLNIAKQGGGILSTVRSTRKMTRQQLLKISQLRVNHFLKQGVSTLEIKSGYGLDLKSEIKMLEVASQLKGPQIITTFLGAHAKPAEFQTHQDYLDYLIQKVFPILKKKKLTRRVDIFIEQGFFDVKYSEKYLQHFKQSGFDITIHANQLSHSGGAQLAAQMKAVSADHVIHLKDRDIANLKKSNTVAVLLPTADLYMKCPYPPARKLIDAGVDVALATDFNPGSCPSQDLMLVGMLARLEMKMTLSEVFKAYTINAAKALGLDNTQGSISIGKLANFISTKAELSDFFYSPGFIPEHQLYIKGQKINNKMR